MRLANIGECMVEATLDRAGPFAGPAKLGFGGDTLNTAVYARRCLPETDGRVAYVTALGDDVFSDSMLTAWRDEGLETDLVYRLAGRRPGFYAIATDEAGERRFYYWRREAAVRSLLEDGRDRDLAARLQSYDLLYLSGITLAILGDEGRGRLLALLQGLRDAGARVAFDGNHRPALWPEPAAAQAAYRAIGQLTDIALPTFDDEAALHGDGDVETTARRWLDWGAGEVVVKRGAAAARSSCRRTASRSPDGRSRRSSTPRRPATPSTAPTSPPASGEKRRSGPRPAAAPWPPKSSSTRARSFQAAGTSLD